MLRILSNIVFVIIFATIMYFYGNIEFMNNKMFNLLTVDTVLVGFLFTTLSMLLSKTEEETLEAYIVNDEFKDIYNNIITGIACGLLSILSTILGCWIFGDIDNGNITWSIKCWYSLDVALFIRILLAMVISIIKIYNILSDIFEKKKIKLLSDKANKSMDKIFNTHYHDEEKKE